MKRSTVTSIVTITALVGLAGCASEQQQQRAATDEGRAAYRTGQSPFAWRPAEEPAPEAAIVEVQQPKQPAGLSLAIPTGQRSSSTLLLEKFAPQEVVAGQPYEYDIKVTNLTDLALDNVTVTDSLPPEFHSTFSSPKQQAGPGGVAMWSLGALGPHEAKTVHMTGSASSAGSITSCASATYTTSLCNTVNVVQPALRMSMTAPADTILCDTIPVKVTILNSGSGIARNIRITDPLPVGLKTTEGKTTLDYAIDSLAAGATKEFAVNLKADKPGLYVTSAFAAADANLKASTSEIPIHVIQPVLSMTVKGPDHLFIGKAATYEIIVTNIGDAVARDTIVENPIPASAMFVSATENGLASGTAVTWKLGELAPKASKTLQATFNYPRIGDFKDTATARAYCAATVSANANTAMAGIPALLLDGFDSPDPVQIGDSTVYTLTVTNQGSAALTNIRVVCTMEDVDNMQYTTSDGATTAAIAGKTITFAPIAKLDAQQKAIYKVTIKAVKEGQVQFKAEVTSDQITRPLSKVETTHFYR